MSEEKKIRVAALVDLPCLPNSGGHTKCWERLAMAAANAPVPLDLTVYFSGKRTEPRLLGPKARICEIPPVFSTATLKAVLPYVPDHTDLAPYHPAVARALMTADVLHTTDGFFAFAKTAERVSKKTGKPLFTSFHTDTPPYARVFARQTIVNLFGETSFIGRLLLDRLKWPERQETKMRQRLAAHVAQCSGVLVTRKEDRAFAERFIGPEKIHHFRLGVDRMAFNVTKRDRDGIERDFGIPKNRIIALFVGRLDVGKNIYTLIDAVEALVREGVPLHLVTAGQGPAEWELKKRLGDHVTVAGYLGADQVARLYASVDLLTMPSEVEIRSMVGVEALSSGCPMFVSSKSGVAGLFNDTPALRAIDGGAEAWADALRIFATDQELRSSMRLEAARYAEKNIASWEDIIVQDLFPMWSNRQIS